MADLTHCCGFFVFIFAVDYSSLPLLKSKHLLLSRTIFSPLDQKETIARTSNGIYICLSDINDPVFFESEDTLHCRMQLEKSSGLYYNHMMTWIIFRDFRSS